MSKPADRSEGTTRGPLSWAAIGYVLVFIVFIAAPQLIKLSGLDPVVKLREKRSMAPRPALDLRPGELVHYSARYEDYFNDQFGLRSWLIRRHHGVLLNLFAVSI
jgi:hypothetical protein